MLARLLGGIYRFGMSLIPERIAVSSRTAAALASEGFPAQAVVKFGLEEEAFGATSLSSPAGAPRFVSCGRLTPIKNVGGAIEAFLALRAKGIPFQFDIVGEGGQRPQLEEKVKAAGAMDVIHFHGEISEEAKRGLLAAGEVFVLSSPREGFSIATLEAMAQGCCAVVVSDPRRENGALDFVRDGVEGLCVAPGLKPMEETLRRLASDAELRIRMRREARKTAEQYRIREQTKRLLEVYAEISGR
jgi:glycosyltransferase involved in cell wall biosynthesis